MSVDVHGCGLGCDVTLWDGEEEGTMGRVRHCAVLSLDAVKRVFSYGAAPTEEGEKRILLTLVAWKFSGAESAADRTCSSGVKAEGCVFSSAGAASVEVVSAADE